MAEISEYQVPTLAHEDRKTEVTPSSPVQSEDLSEKSAYIAEKQSAPEIADQIDKDDEDEVIYVKGEPVITTGRDVSRFVVDIRDDVLGTLCSGLGATLVQVDSKSISRKDYCSEY
jgi:hypothetical protein